MSAIKPLGDRVLLKVLTQEEKTAGGIIIPDTAKEKTQRAEVAEIGDSEDIKVKVGDVVIYDKYAGISLKEQDAEYLIVKHDEIVAKIV